MRIAEYVNTNTGVKSYVVQAEDGLFDVAAFDTDAGRMIGARHGFATEAAAKEYAAKFIADTIPAGTSVAL